MVKKQKNNVFGVKKLLSPKLDVVFQAIFGEIGNENITKDFLETILDNKIERVNLDKNLVLRREFENDKLGILDVLVELDGKEKCNIEMQMIDKDNIIERILHYWSKIYISQIKSGQDYKLEERTIVILITNYEIKGLEKLNYHTRWKIIESENIEKIVLTEKFEIDILELPKIKDMEHDNCKLMDWLLFLENPNSERVIQKMKENNNLKDAVSKLYSLSEDEKMQRIAELREKAIMDEKATYRKGLKDGIEQEKEHEKKEKIKIAKQLLNKGLSKNEVIKIMGVSEEEI